MPIKVLPAASSFGSEFAKAFGSGISSGVQEAAKELREKKLNERQNRLLEEENSAAEEMGIKLKGIHDTKLRQLGFEHGLNSKNQAQELQQGLADYNTIEKAFGTEFADIWKAAPTGGKTELLTQGLEALLRGEDIKDVLQGAQAPEEQDLIPDELPQLKKGEVSKEFNWPDFTKRPKGYLPKDWKDERKAWRSENAPIFEANKTRLQNVNDDILATKKLTQLNDSGKLPEGLERLLLNPETGEFYGAAQLAGTSREVQEWVKTIARFQNRAKDAFGSRVTNFDLQSYMKQFPGLINTTEGRDRILDMMKINYDMDKLYDSALDQVYKHYGLNGIPQEKADELASKMIKKETEKLRADYLGLDALNQEETGLSGRLHDVMGPDGQMYQIDEREIGQLPEGYRLVPQQG